MKEKLTKELLQQLFVKENKSTQEVAEITGQSVSWVRKKIKEYGLNKPCSQEKINSYKPVIIDLYINQDKTLDEISGFFNISRSELVKFLRNNNINKGRAEAKLVTVDQIKELYIDKHCTVNEISSRLKIGRSKIYQIIKENNLSQNDHNLDYDEVYDLYINKNYSARMTAKYLGFHENAVNSFIRKNNIIKDKEIGKHSVTLSEIKHENLTFENVKKFYIEENKTIPEVAKTLNVPQSTLTLAINRYELKKDKNLIEKQRVMNRKKTNLERYGSEYAIQNNEIKDKKDQTNLRKYGTTAPSSTPEVIEKIKKTKIERYGTYNTSSLEEFKDKIRKTCLEKYGVEYSCMAKHCREASHKVISRINREWAKKLNCEEFETQIGLYSFDIKKDNVLIEVNPTITHNSTVGPVWFKNSKPKDKNYHQDKLIVALENNYYCFMIWDWDDEEKIINYFKSRQKIFARETKIEEVSEKECNEFLNQYHFQNTCRGQTLRLGLYKDDQLLEIMTFGKPRYNKSYQWELLRLCTKPDFIVIGGASKLFKHFVSEYNPESIISYCDLSKFSGKVYESLGMKKESYSKPSCHWYNIKTHQHITDNLLRQRGADQLLGTKDGKGTSNKEIMLREGFVEVYDCGQAAYVWKA